MTGFANEKEMQDAIGEIIRSGDLKAHIRGGEGLEDLVRESASVMPVFSIDRISRVATIRAAIDCLDDLGDLQILTDDQNVSMEKGETLRPDFVAISVEDRSIWIVELKNRAQPAREAFTELLGYEHEVKNHLPFLADWDVNFVLISSEWSTLLDHSLASACTWSGKKVLGLEATRDDAGEVALTVRIPQAWTITGVAQFPIGSLPCFQIEIEGLGEGTNEEPDEKLFLALNMLAREGDRLGSHGFAMLWRDRAHGDTGQCHLTLCGVAPEKFFEAAVGQGTIDTGQGHLGAALQNAFKDFGDPTPSSLVRLYHRLTPLIEEVGECSVAGFMDWTQARDTYLHRAEPIAMEFWGILGDYARRYVLHPAIRAHRSDLLANGRADWRTPSVGMLILEELFPLSFCAGGQIRLKDAFELGRDISIDNSIRLTLGQPGIPDQLKAWLEPRLQWHSMRMQFLLEQMRATFMSTTTESDLEAPLTYSLGSAAFSEASMIALVGWIRDKFLNGSHAHLQAFEFGFDGGTAFDDTFIREVPQCRDRLEGLGPRIQQAREAALELATGLRDEGGLDAAQEHRVSRLESLGEPDAETLVAAFELMDTFILPVYHELASIPRTDVDWAWLKQGIDAARAKGRRSAVRLGADGNLGVCDANGPAHMCIAELDDPETEVFFINDKMGFSMMIRTTWEALKQSADFEDLEALPTVKADS